MAKQDSQLDSGGDFEVNDLPDPNQTAGAGSQRSTPSREATSEEIAQRPEIQEAFDGLFGTGRKQAPKEAPSQATRRANSQTEEEDAEELADLEGADEDSELPKQDEQEGPDEEDADEPDAQEDESGQEGDTPTLSPVLRQAAKRAGWSDEDIDALATEKPELAEQTFQRMLQSFNSLSAEYGRLGASQQQGGGPAQPPQQQQFPPQQQPQQQQMTPPPQQDEGMNLLQELYGEQLPTLQQKYGQDFVNDILTPLVRPVQQLQQQYQAQQQQAVAQEIGQFFSNLPEEFSELYGKGDQVNEDQYGARARLAQLADQIQWGASRQGVELSVSEALERANLMHAAEHMEALTRKRITQSVKKRSKQLTNRPSQRKSAAPQEGSEKSAEEAYRRRAAELGIEV